MNIKKFSKKALISFGLGGAFVVGSVVFAAATIPAACSTPGTCTDISSTFQAVVSKTSMKFLDSDASNFVELKAPATVASDLTLTLPATAGNDGEVLATDGSGNLNWKKLPLNDKSDSGYVDIGEMRIQWGTLRKQHDDWNKYYIIFPQEFRGGTIPAVSVSITDNPGGKMAAYLGSADNTNFGYWAHVVSGGITGESRVHWQAIGLKP